MRELPPPLDSAESGWIVSAPSQMSTNRESRVLRRCRPWLPKLTAKRRRGFRIGPIQRIAVSRSAARCGGIRAHRIRSDLFPC